MSEHLGNYEILRRLAAGGMAEVLLAKQIGMGGFERLVCLKRILPHLGSQQDFIHMFQDEARIAANLLHPNIAQIYDIAQQGEDTYIVMEYIRGEDLRRVYNQEVHRGQTIPANIAAQVVMGAAAGLDYAHKQCGLDGKPLGIVHRDVSPQNIVITYDGFIKLIDFGVAKATGKLMQTRSGVLKGKYSYMSPEQASGALVDGRTDIFALGITLYEITTGTRLFKRDNELETLHAVIACKITPPSQLVESYDADLESIVLKALAYNPDDRYQTAGDMGQDLEQYLLTHHYSISAAHLATYMHDLFADKLADEALFGGQPWSEPATSSRLRLGGTQKKSDIIHLQDNDILHTQIDETMVDVPKEEANHTTILSDWDTDEELLEDTKATLRVEKIAKKEPEPKRTYQLMSEILNIDNPPADPHVKAFAQDPHPKLAKQQSNKQWLWISTMLTCLLLVLGGAGYFWHKQKVHTKLQAQTAIAPVEQQPLPTTENTQSPAVAVDMDHAWLTVTAPIAMHINADNSYLGETPLLHLPMQPGAIRLRLENKDEGLIIRRNVRLKAGKPTQLIIAPQHGHLQVIGQPWVWVQIGNHPAMESPVELDLFAGEYTLNLECPDGRRNIEVIHIQPNTTHTTTVSCESVQTD